ncbi:MAG: hypothetical protein M1839_004008 [Geoglossum umbratile]|nr:MAG: hypothetical protein M1839_004008 [Geoglossum umbratile]
MTGYSNERFGDVSVTGSAAGDGSSRLDPYRKSVQTIKSPPDGGRSAQPSKDAEEDYKKYHGSRFDQLSKEYKTLDNQAEGAEGDKKFLGTAEKHSAREARGVMAETFIGYDSYTGYSGHQERIALLKAGENYMKKKRDMHSRSHDG